ncbi:MAG: DUF294 nucleotidyltransferase-like domain-containing protein [Inquilinaceae bacterium]
MDLESETVTQFLSGIHPYDTLPPDELKALSEAFRIRECAAGTQVYGFGERLEGLYVILSGAVAVTDESGAPISLLGPRNSFGERGLLRDGLAAANTQTVEPARLLVLPAARFSALLDTHPAFRRFFTRSQGSSDAAADLTNTRVDALMTADPVTVGPDMTVNEAARLMRDRRISSLGVDRSGRLVGILTVRDLASRVVADGLSGETPVSQVMTADPISLPASSIGSDVLHMMMERGVGHVPIVEGERLVGMVTQTDLTRFQAMSSAETIAEVVKAQDAETLAGVTARIPQLLAQLVGAGQRHEVVTRLITDIADAVTRRLLVLAEARLGPPPVPYLWLACGSQGRQEQSGVSDQDNVLMLDDAVTADDLRYFDDLAAFVTAGLDRAGYVFCPGEMMASNPRWRQPVRVWRDYFAGWIASPSPEARMLASVMFDLRPIGGTVGLFSDLREDTLRMAASNSIFVAHMVANSLTHAPPLGLLRGFATVRRGEHRNLLDMKLNGVVPVVDLGRIYTLTGRLAPVNTRARLQAARAAGLISEGGGRDLIGAYDLIARSRLNHQARQVRAGAKPDNFLPVGDLSDFERSHLRDAFVVVRTMQSAVGQGRGTLT